MELGAPIVRLPAVSRPTAGRRRAAGVDRLSTDRVPSAQRRLLPAAGVLAAVYSVVVWLQAGTTMPEWIPLMASWVVFVPIAIWVVRRGRSGPGRDGLGRRGLLLLAVAAVVVQLPGLFAAPQMSTDSYRYVWDGRVQVAGVDPYRYVPLDDHLAGLRDPILFPGLGTSDRTGVVSRGDSFADAREPVDTGDRYDLTMLNRPSVPTIYPPLAQAWFAVVAVLTPAGWGTFGIQLSFLLAAVATTVLIGWSVRRAGRDPGSAFVYAACPAVFIESASNAHVDVLAAGLIVAAVVFAHRRWVAGILLGAAIAVKLTPVLLIPAFLGRHVRDSAATLLASVATVVAVYLPHALVVGWLVLGYLPGYLSEEGYEAGGEQFRVIALLLPDVAPQTQSVIAVLLAVAVAVLCIRQARSRPTAQVAVQLLGAALLIATPTYPWYVVPLLALAVLARRYEWFVLGVAAYGAYAFYDHAHLPGLFFTAAAVVVGGCAVVRATSVEARIDRRGPGPARHDAVA
jgi:hypothetical protein